VRRFYGDRPEFLASPAGINTVDTNSSLAERRGDLLVEMLTPRWQAEGLEHARVVDVGCGFGALSAFFAAHGAAVTGIDLVQDRFAVGEAVAVRHALDVTFLRADMADLGVLDARSFDLAVANNSLCYMTDQARRDRALREIFRVLRPGGWVILRNPNRASLVDPFTGLPVVALLPIRVSRPLLARFGIARSKVLLTTPRRALRELEGAGFERVELARAPGRRHTGLLGYFARYHHVVGRRPET
jgi:SAM-dependent methyltransferase